MALVATYTATLPQPLQLECYAKFLEGERSLSKHNYPTGYFVKKYPREADVEAKEQNLF